MNAGEILDRIRSLSVLVVGDICLDRWCTYDPLAAEPSRETGLPRTAVCRNVVTAGAGGTVANNVVALGVRRAAVLGVVGDDGHGYELRRQLQRTGIQSDLLVTAEDRLTFTYTKLINRATGDEDLPRIDFINQEPLDAAADREMALRVAAEAPRFDVILISDQSETDHGGVVTPAVREALQRVADRHPEKTFWVDSRRRIHLFRRMVLKPNAQEAAAACQELFQHLDYRELQRHCEALPLLVTHGGDGVSVVDEQGEKSIATPKTEKPVDICGAGDSFSAGGALTLAVTKDIRAAVHFGHLVASITIMKRGTGTASPQEVLTAAAAAAPAGVPSR
jgi:rfaE bifunctional protein kinase chain/domain